MGRKQVHAAIVNTLTTANLQDVGTVYPARPIVLDEADYTTTLTGQAIQESANGSAMVIVVNLNPDKRWRVSDTGRAYVNDMATRLVELELYFASTGGDAIAAQEDYDGIYDDLEALIRGNPSMSAPATVWSAGEYRFGIRHSQGAPFNPEDDDDSGGLTTLIIGVVQFEAWEQLNGPAGTV